MRGLIKITLVGFLSLLLVACFPSHKSESAGEYLDSTATTTKVKASLLDDLGSSGFAIKVKTYKDEVQLSGFVDTPRIKARAAAIASGVNGVRRVRNDIIVKSR